jgi:hypothetical protein
MSNIEMYRKTEKEVFEIKETTLTYQSGDTASCMSVYNSIICITSKSKADLSYRAEYTYLNTHIMLLSITQAIKTLSFSSHGRSNIY